MRAPPLLSWSLGLLVACSGARGPRVCHGSAACGEGEACVTGACAPLGASGALGPSAGRVTIEPRSIAFVLSEDDGPGLPAAAPLGASIGPRARILLGFAKPTIDRTVQRAYLVLERAEGAQAGPGEVTVRAEHIVDPWSLQGGLGVTWATPPRAEAIVGAETRVAATGAGVLRVDVTSWFVTFARRHTQSWGLRVEGAGEGYGVPIATGWARGARPHLEVYFQ